MNKHHRFFGFTGITCQKYYNPKSKWLPRSAKSKLWGKMICSTSVDVPSIKLSERVRQHDTSRNRLSFKASIQNILRDQNLPEYV